MRITNLKPRRSTALLSAAVVAVSGIVATMGASNAAVTLGPDRADGLPAYVVDGQGLAVAPCDTNTAICGGAFDPADPAYWDAGGAAGPIKLIYSVSSPAGGRIARFTGSGLAPGNYKIQDPWGSLSCPTDAAGKMDCRRNGRRITTLLHNNISPAGFAGSPNINRRFTGSPRGFNRVLITGPGGFKASTNKLAISGLLRDNTAMSSIDKKALVLGNGRQATAVTRTVRYMSFGTAAARPTVRKGGTNARAFTVRDNCASQAPGSACSITVKYVPRQHVNTTSRAFLVINDNGLADPRRVSLKGVGLRR
jgi:hypothetical protein